MKKLLLTLTISLSCNLLNAGSMPEKELDHVDDYISYIYRQIGRVDDEMDDLFDSIDHDGYEVREYTLLKDEDIAKYTMLLGMKEAYYDCLFWVKMIGKAIPRD